MSVNGFSGSGVGGGGGVNSRRTAGTPNLRHFSYLDPMANSYRIRERQMQVSSFGHSDFNCKIKSLLPVSKCVERTQRLARQVQQRDDQQFTA